jgi:hypothetical protein
MEYFRSRARSSADDRCASAMEGTSCADDMILLHEREEKRLLFPLIRIWFWEAGDLVQLMFVTFSAQ